MKRRIISISIEDVLVNELKKERKEGDISISRIINQMLKKRYNIK